MAEYDAVFTSNGKTHCVILVTKLDFVAFQPQLLKYLSIYWFYFSNRTNHMQDEDGICLQKYFFKNC